MAYTNFQGINGFPLQCSRSRAGGPSPEASSLPENPAGYGRIHDEGLQALIEAIQASVAILDMDGRVVAANQDFRAFAECMFADLMDLTIGRDYAAIITNRMGTCPQSVRLDHGIRQILAGASGPCRTRLWVQVGGESQEFAVVASPFDYRNARHVMVCHHDVSAISNFRNSPEGDAHLQIVAEQLERRRIGQELHDTTAQQLVVLSLLIHRIGGVNSDDEVGALVAEARKTIDDALKDLRSFSYMLHPPQDGWPGLHDALEHLARGLSDRTGLRISFDDATSGDNVQAGVELAIYRIAQEALTNVYRHAGASSVDVRIGQSSNELVLSICDDGHGFDMARAAPGVGLASMRERAEALGGALKVVSGVNGTMVSAHVPLKTSARPTAVLQHEIIRRLILADSKPVAPSAAPRPMVRPALHP